MTNPELRDRLEALDRRLTLLEAATAQPVKMAFDPAELARVLAGPLRDELAKLGRRG